MILHRGLSFPSHAVERIADDIRRHGLLAGAGRWTMLFPDLKPRLKQLRASRTLQRSDVETEEATPPWVCACARRVDALYYACRHNRSAENDASVLVSFEAPERDVIVDGRDFLFPVFQFGVPELARPALATAFGSASLYYADRAWSSKEPASRISWCDLAIQDDEVVAAHAKNRTFLAGKQGTVFSSAFMARAPVPPQDIRAVEVVDADDFFPPEVGISLRSITTFGP